MLSYDVLRCLTLPYAVTLEHAVLLLGRFCPPVFIGSAFGFAILRNSRQHHESLCRAHQSRSACVEQCCKLDGVQSRRSSTAARCHFVVLLHHLECVQLPNQEKQYVHDSTNQRNIWKLQLFCDALLMVLLLQQILIVQNFDGVCNPSDYCVLHQFEGVMLVQG